MFECCRGEQKVKETLNEVQGQEVWSWCVIHAALLTQTEKPKVLEDAGCIVFICFLTVLLFQG